MSRNQNQTIVKIVKKENPFVMIDKSCLQDTRLSWKAKGLLSYLLSLPDDWRISLKEVQRHSSDGRESLASGMRELIKYGYASKEIIREQGKISAHIYQIYEDPIEVSNEISNPKKPVNPKKQNIKKDRPEKKTLKKSQATSIENTDIEPQTGFPFIEKSDPDENFLSTTNGFSVYGKTVYGKPAPTNIDITNNDFTNNQSINQRETENKSKTKIKETKNEIDGLIENLKTESNKSKKESSLDLEEKDAILLPDKKESQIENKNLKTNLESRTSSSDEKYNQEALFLDLKGINGGCSANHHTGHKSLLNRKNEPNNQDLDISYTKKQMLSVIQSKKSIPSAFVSTLENATTLIKLLTEDEVLTDPSERAALDLLTTALSEMLTEKGLYKYGDRKLSGKDILEKVNRNLEIGKSYIKFKGTFTNEVINSFIDALNKTPIQNIKGYMKTCIANGFDTHQLKFLNVLSGMGF